MIKKVILTPNPYRDGGFRTVLAAQKILQESGIETRICLPFEVDKSFVLPKDIRFSRLDRDLNWADLVICFGGDGTILETARRAMAKGTPILGINLGRVGYMAELELDELDMLHRLFTGEYEIEKRSMLRVELRSGGDLRSFCYALNDAVISNGSISRIVDLELSEGGVHIANYRSDGLIVATPTGSTAYSLAAGGAIVDPRLNCLCITPICPHSLYARPLIFPDSACVEIKNTCQREKTLFLTVDGRMNYELSLGESVRVTRSPLKTYFIRIKDGSFYDRLRQKMNDK